MNAADLQAFCADREDIRYYLRKPWSDGEYTYASNGHIIVRVSRLPDVAEEPKAPNAAGLIAKIAPASNWMPVPVAVMPPMIECDECHGTGLYIDPFDNDPTQQPSPMDCEWCNHTGKVKKLVGVRVDNAWFDQGYLSMLQGWEISPDGTKKAAWIRNVNIEADGLLMPRDGP